MTFFSMLIGFRANETFCLLTGPTFSGLRANACSGGEPKRIGMLGNSLWRQADFRASFGRTQLRVALIALKRTADRVNLLVATSAERIACPKCHWNCAHRSRPRKGLDSLLGLFKLHPFRCRSCHRRYYRLSL